MTRIEKSDAQLDAEAVARRRNLELPSHDHGFDDPDAYDVPGFHPSSKPDPAPDPVGLERAILLHRGMHRDDSYIDRMVARQPPTTRDPNTGEIKSHEAAAIGMNMSARLYRYVEAPGPSEFPWRSAFMRLRYECRRNHPYHTGPTVPYWRGSLCQELVRLVVIGPERRIPSLPEGPVSVENAAEILRYDNPEPVLRYALSWIEEAMDRARQKAEKRQRDEQGRGPGAVPEYVPVHHAVPGMHMADCPQCRRNAA